MVSGNTNLHKSSLALQPAAPQVAPRLGGRALGETLLCAGEECAGRLRGARILSLVTPKG